jgi:hypothetical protein
MTRAISTPPDSIEWDYVIERVRRYNNEPSDDLLYRIGTHVNTLTLEDQDLSARQDGNLSPEQRYRVLDWLAVQSAAGLLGLEIEGDLALLIFGHDQLSQWLERSRQAYPNFEFFLVFEAHPEGMLTGHKGIDFTMYWMPQPGAPEPSVECDFPWKCCWEHGEMFWGGYPGETANQFEFNLFVYPDQHSFATPGAFCSAGSRYTTPSDEEADLMSVAQVLAARALNARWT